MQLGTESCTSRIVSLASNQTDPSSPWLSHSSSPDRYSASLEVALVLSAVQPMVLEVKLRVVLQKVAL